MAFVITSFEMSILFCRRSLIDYWMYLTAYDLWFLIRIISRTFSNISLIKRQLSLLTVSSPFLSTLSCSSGLVKYNPAYLFLATSRNGEYTFSNSSWIGQSKYSVIYFAAIFPLSIAYLLCPIGSSAPVSSWNFTITESVSPYITSAPYFYITKFFVFSIICLPIKVTVEEICKHGSIPTVAPVNP